MLGAQYCVSLSKVFFGSISVTSQPKHSIIPQILLSQIANRRQSSTSLLSSR